MLDIEMRQLEYFVAAASAGSYSQAAKQLFVSPQAISKGVQVLESRIGIALFERGPSGIALTKFGRTFCRESEAVLKSLERLQYLAERHRSECAMSFSVGIHSLCFKEHGGSIEWNNLLEFHEAYPEITPSFIEMRGDSIIESVGSGTLDFGISGPAGSDFDSHDGVLLKHFPMAALILGRNDHFATYDVITIKELTQGQLVLLSEEREFNNFFIRKAQNEGLAVNLASLQIRADSDIDFVTNRNLYAIRPLQHALRTTKGDSVRILPILDASGKRIEMPLHIFWKKGKELTPLEEAFVTMVSGLYR